MMELENTAGPQGAVKAASVADAGVLPDPVAILERNAARRDPAAEPGASQEKASSEAGVEAKAEEAGESEDSLLSMIADMMVEGGRESMGEPLKSEAKGEEAAQDHAQTSEDEFSLDRFRVPDQVMSAIQNGDSNMLSRVLYETAQVSAAHATREAVKAISANVAPVLVRLVASAVEERAVQSEVMQRFPEIGQNPVHMKAFSLAVAAIRRKHPDADMREVYNRAAVETRKHLRAAGKRLGDVAQEAGEATRVGAKARVSGKAVPVGADVFRRALQDRIVGSNILG